MQAGSIVARSDGQVRELFPLAIGADEGVALRAWVRAERAVETLEIGLGFAVATLFICEGLIENGPGGRHVAIDPFQVKGPGEHNRLGGVGLQVLDEAGVSGMVDFYAEESQLVLPRLLADGRRFDLAFVDGNHRFEGVFLDLIYLGRLVKERGILFVDDMQFPAIRRAVEFCVSNLGWMIEEEGDEGEYHRWAVLRTSEDEVFLRPFDQFVDFMP